MGKRANDRKHIEDLKKLAQSQAEFKQKVLQARRGQVFTAEATATFLKPVTEPLLGKQPEIKPLSEEELKKLHEKGLVGFFKEQQDAAAAKIVARSDETRLAEALVANIADPAARRTELNRLINNPLEFEWRLSELTTYEIRDLLGRLSEKLEDIEKEQNEIRVLTTSFLGVGEKRRFLEKQPVIN